MKHHYFFAAIPKLFLVVALFFFSGTASATTQTITVQNTVFTPSSVTVNLGDTIKWVWINGVHTTTSTTIPAGAASWNHDMNSTAGNTEFIYVPTVLGTYNYWCLVHGSFMVASFTVICGTPSLTISAGGSTTFCSGGSVVLSQNSGTSFSSYQWKRNGILISGETTTSTTASIAGSYTLAATNSCGSTGTSNAISVTVNTAPTAGQAAISAGGATTFCSGGSVTLTVATAGLTYQWNNGGSPISGATSQNYSATATGSYNCDVSNSCGTTGSNSISVTVNTAPTSGDATISAGGATTFCSGGNVVLSAASAGFNYQWKNGASSISGATLQNYTATASGSYTCDVSNSCGTVGSNSISITVNTAPTSAQATISAGGSTTFCSGGSVVLSVATTGLTYQWKNGGSPISGETNQSYTATSSGSYTCDVSNSCGTTGSNSISVNANAAPTSAQATISAGGSTTFCNGGNVVLSVATSGFSYQWKNGGSAISGATLQNYTATASGAYTCDVSNSCGTTPSNSITVTVNTAPTASQAAISANGSTTFCSGGSVVLTVATAGLTYQWKRGNKNLVGYTQQTYTASKAYTYSCIVSNSCGSITSNSITVVTNPAPTASVSMGSCSGGAVLLTCTFTPATGVTLQWQKSNVNISGATNSTYSATVKGTYKCIATITATGCTKLSNAAKVTITCKAGDNVSEDTRVIVYPNPTSDYFNINTSQLDAQSMIYIYDLTGRLVESHEVNGSEMQVGGSLSNGVYFLKIEGDKETQQVIKLVKNL